MLRTFSSVHPAAGFFLALAAIVTACGGSQPPAESPEAAPAAESESRSEDEHTMPDGTKMEGESHGEHTMPDGTKMKGDSHESGEEEQY